MKKIVIFCLIILLAGCNKDTLYQSIEPQNEEITTIEDFFYLYKGVLLEMEFRYCVFIDIRSEAAFYDGRVSCFKQNIYYSGKDAEYARITNLTKQIGKKGYVFLIGSKDNSYVFDLNSKLIEDGYLNVKVLSMGTEGFYESLLNSSDYSTELYWEYGECGC